MDTRKEVGQRTFLFDDTLETWIEQFLFDRKAQNLAVGTLAFYKDKLKAFSVFCEMRAIKDVGQITSHELRLFVTWLEAKHNAGGIHAFYRAVRALLKFYESEAEPENWKNPLRKVKAPRVKILPLEPVSVEHIGLLLNTCNGASWTDARDRSIIYGLLDTGARANEFLSLNVDDLNNTTGAALIRSGKGGKPRTVYFGKAALKALRVYLRGRDDKNSALWITDEGERLRYWGLRSMIRRRAIEAGIKPPGLHDFRRAFALSLLRSGIDIVTISRLMGHANLEVLTRYLKQETIDFASAHRRASPGDNLNK